MVINMSEYSTRQVFYDSQPDLLESIQFNCDVKLSFRADPSNMHWVGEQGDSFSMLQYFPETKILEALKANNKNAYELIILSSDKLISENINSLIYSGRLLCCPEIKYIEYGLFETNRSDKLIGSGGNCAELFRQQEISGDMILACLIASFASNNNLEYALEKYKFSLTLDHFTPHSADPYYGKVFYTDISPKRNHVNSMYSFLSAYSIIEELGLEIRSSSQKPRFIKEEWNPVVLEDIIERLQKNGISQNETIEWLVRGEPSPIYDKIRPSFIRHSEWYDPNNNVFDLELKIYEAIDYCSYIRNFFLAHKANNIVKYLNPYDIFNIQNLSRRLILSSLGVWDNMFNFKDLII